nr:MAG TPA: hypothetical protein [Caudoviricetes sp.]
MCMTAGSGTLEVRHQVTDGAGYLRYHRAIRRKFEFFIYCHDLPSFSAVWRNFCVVSNACLMLITWYNS